MVDVSDCLFEFLKNHSSLHNSLNFFHCFVLITNLNNLFIFFHNFFNPLHDDWDLDNLLNNILNVFIDVDELRHNLFNLYDSWNFNEFFFKTLNFVDLGHNNWFFDNFLNNLFGSNDLLHCVLNWYNLFSDNFNFFDLISNVRNFLHNFLYLSVNHYFLLDSHKFNWLRLNCILNNNLFYYSWNLDNLLNNLMHRHKLFNNSVNWNWNFNWNDDLSFDFNNFGDLDMVVHYLLDRNVPWNFLNHFNNSLLNALVINDSFFNSL